MLSQIKSSDEDTLSSDEDTMIAADDEDITTIYTTSIPEKSRAAYESCYKHFVEWMKESNVTTITQQVMLFYFKQKSKNRVSSTMWSEYSKLKCMIYLEHKVDISTFYQVTAFLKRKSIGHVAKKSKMLTKSDFDRFLAEANDNEYLMIKAALIIGMAAACRREELLRLSTNEVVDTGDLIRIDIMDTKTQVLKQFVMAENSVGNRYLMNILRDYMSRRNPTTPHDRFFVGYRSGRCTVQPVGINTIGAIPRKVAQFLGLSDAELFTGHCFRRSSAQVLADCGAQFSVFQRHATEGLRRMIPNYKQQNESNSGQSSSHIKIQLKSEPNPTNERDDIENTDFRHQDHDDEDLLEEEDVQPRQGAECETKPQIFNINYVVPSSLIIRENQTEQQSAERCSAAKDTSRELIDQPTDESDQDHHMQDYPGEVLPDSGNSYSLSAHEKVDNLRGTSMSQSTQEKIANLRLREMENRVTESRLRCEVQRLMVSKAEEEFKHLQEMNRLRLQEANMRLKLLEQSCASGGVNVDSLNRI